MTKILVIALGGAIGSVARYLIANSVDLAPGKFPFLTLSINAIGSFMMGVAFVILVEKSLFPSEIRDFVIIGFDFAKSHSGCSRASSFLFKSNRQQKFDS